MANGTTAPVPALSLSPSRTISHLPYHHASAHKLGPSVLPRSRTKVQRLRDRDLVTSRPALPYQYGLTDLQTYECHGNRLLRPSDTRPPSPVRSPIPFGQVTWNLASCSLPYQRHSPPSCSLPYQWYSALSLPYHLPISSSPVPSCISSRARPSSPPRTKVPTAM